MLFPSPTDALRMPSFARPVFGGTSFAQPRPGLSQTFDQMMEMSPWIGDVLRLAGHGGMATVGLFVGITQSGPWSTIGWIVGLMSGFAAFLDMCSLVGRIFGTHP